VGKIARRISVKKGTWQSICEGRKTLLVRTDDRIFVTFGAGEALKIDSGQRVCTCDILAIRRYPTLEALLAAEDLNRIAHGSHQEAKIYLEEIYAELPEFHTFVVLELKLTHIGHKCVSRG
jgi:ASC-1-like (ASCH) protein